MIRCRATLPTRWWLNNVRTHAPQLRVIYDASGKEKFRLVLFSLFKAQNKYGNCAVLAKPQGVLLEYIKTPAQSEAVC